MTIESYLMQEILDPTNIIEGQRFEFTLDLMIDEDDELFQEGGIEVRAIIGVKDHVVSLVNYFLIAKADLSYLEFALEEDEEKMIIDFCTEKIKAEK
ncbi:DUF6509 family protein [Kurthia sibirica]|uniref:Pullulanase n=1 Tax=Kurthia sibirica TaxID=202750 RepID=A0A2U3AQ88_9BACL|nr:DUF6509 family protein [Kurthia sibirica]PWI26684.1 pullulanase [Kurthia sibirica]GEK32953.1 hypothetical protein KSI01_04860 [Kurthia sibirica]